MEPLLVSSLVKLLTSVNGGIIAISVDGLVSKTKCCCMSCIQKMYILEINSCDMIVFCFFLAVYLPPKSVENNSKCARA